MGAADQVLRMCALLLGEDLGLRIRAWDGSEAGPPEAACLQVRSPRAIRRLMYQPNQLGLGRAYVAGEIDVDGDLFEVLEQLGDRVEDKPLSWGDKITFMRLAADVRRHRPSAETSS